MRQLAVAGEGIVCRADFMTSEDRRKGELVPLLTRKTWTSASVQRSDAAAAAPP